MLAILFQSKLKFISYLNLSLNSYSFKEIRDICEINASSYSKKDNWNYFNYLDTKNIIKGEINEIKYLDPAIEKIPSRAKRKVNVDDIIISTVRPNQEHYGMIKYEMDNFLVSTGFTTLTVDKTKAVPEFIYFYITQNHITESLQTIAEQSTTSYPSIRPSDIGDIIINLPPLEIQKRISNILSNIENKIEINKNINKNLYEISLNYFNEIFDHEDKNCKLSDIVNIRRGASPRPIKDYISDTGINWLKISDVTGTEMPFIYKIKEKIIEKGKSKSVFIKKGTLVVSNSATPGIPKFIMVDTCVHDGWLVLYGYEDNLRYYLYFLIVKIRKELINLAYGSVFNNLKTDTLKNYEISKPKDDQLDRFNKIAKPIMEKIDSNTKEIIMLSKLRDTLLPKLMSGEIDVSKINCDLE